MFGLPSHKRSFTTEFHCTACGHTFRRGLRRIYVDGPTFEQQRIHKQQTRHSPFIIPLRIVCPKCQAVDQYELTSYTTTNLSMAVTMTMITEQRVEGHPVKVIAFGLEDGRVVHPLDVLDEYRNRLAAAPYGADAPQDANLRMRYANTLRSLGYFDEAQAEYTALIEQNPARLEAWYNLAAIHVAQKHKREAKKALLNLLGQAQQASELSQAEAGWANNAQHYLQGDWPLDELTPQGIFESAPIGHIPSTVRKRRQR